MSFKDEYAKLVRVTTRNSANKGFQATLKLPSSATVPQPYDYINFYCGFGPWECGISIGNKPQCKDPNGEIKWIWFANTPDPGDDPDNDKGAYRSSYRGIFFNNSDVIKIRLERTTNDKIVFSVNDNAVYTSLKKYNEYSANLSNPSRLILAAGQNGLSNPLPPWRIWHNQVVVSNMQYKNSSNSWVKMTNANNIELDAWPTDREHPEPKYYILDKSNIGNAQIYASLKQF